MSLRSDVLQSVKWMTGIRFVGQLITWAITIVVIRILDPSDYGLMAMAQILISFAVLFRELGLFEAMVQKRDLSSRQVEQAFGLLLLGNSTIFVILFIGAPWVAAFFGEPRLVPIIRVLAIQFPLASIGVVQDAMLSRRMDFKRKSFVQLGMAIGNGFTTLALALSGAGVWALVYGSLVGSIIRPIALTVAARYWCRPRFSRQGMGEILRFGTFITTSRIMWYLYSKADILIIGKLLGKEMLGFYNIAMELASLPSRKTAEALSQVGLAAYSSVQQNMDQVRSHYLKVIRTLSFISFPIFWGISSVSPEFVNTVLGTRWAPAIIPLQLIALVMPIRMLAHGSGQPITAIGKPHLSTLGQAFALLIMPPAFFLGAWYGGLLGTALAWVIGYPLLQLVRMRISLPALGLTYNDYFRAALGPAWGGAAMYAIVILTRRFIAQPFLSPVAGLITLIAVGGITYALFMWALKRQNCNEILDLLAR